MTKLKLPDGSVFELPPVGRNDGGRLGAGTDLTAASSGPPMLAIVIGAAVGGLLIMLLWPSNRP